MFGLINRGIMPQSVTDEFENFTSRLKGLWTKEHNEDGTHGDITASSITLENKRVGELVNVPYNSAKFNTLDAGIWTVSESNYSYINYAQVGQLIFVNFEILNSTLTFDTTDGFTFTIPEVHAVSTFIGPSGEGLYQDSMCGEWFCTDETATAREGLILASVFPSIGGADTVPYTKIVLNCWEDGLAFHQFPKGTYSVLRGSLWFFADKSSNVAVRSI